MSEVLPNMEDDLVVNDIESNHPNEQEQEQANDETKDSDELVDNYNPSATPIETSDSPSATPPANNVFSEAEALLDMLRLNGISRGDYHGQNYLRLKNTLYCYRVPIIILSAVNAFFASSTQAYIKQTTISTVTTVISLICGIITGIELFLNVQANAEAELRSHKKYYGLSTEILRTLILHHGQSEEDMATYVNQKFADYMRINMASSVIMDDFEDILVPPQPLVVPIINRETTHIPLKKTSADVIRKLFSPQKYRRKLQNKQLIRNGQELRTQMAHIRRQQTFDAVSPAFNEMQPPPNIPMSPDWAPPIRYTNNGASPSGVFMPPGRTNSNTTYSLRPHCEILYTNERTRVIPSRVIHQVHPGV
jgi:hypothetical protein